MRKKYILMLALALGIFGTTMAQDFKSTLGTTLTNYFQAKEMTEKINQSNRLVLIAKKYNDQWAASYYAALSKILINYDEKDGAKKDAYLDDAEDMLNTATTLSDKNNKLQQSEIYALKAMLANARIGVAPQKRYQKYGKIFEDNLELAKANNENNPRVYFLKGTSVFYTPKMFGGGKKKAVTYFEKAAPLFASEKKDDINAPFWGEEVNKSYIEQCKGDD
jgi:hypothetical protein